MEIFVFKIFDIFCFFQIFGDFWSYLLIVFKVDWIIEKRCLDVIKLIYEENNYIFDFYIVVVKDVVDCFVNFY